MTTDVLVSQADAPRVVAGFWRRVGAFALDAVVLGVMGQLMGMFLAERFVEMGAWGRLLGFVVAGVYFGFLNSRLGGGQTLGKRILRIKVVARDGSLLAPPRAFLRFLPLGIPWFLNGAQFPETALLSGWAYLLSVAVFGLGLSLVYLFLFNRRSRQSLDDLLVGSYVVPAASSGEVPAAATGPLHRAVCAALLLASAAVPYFTQQLATSTLFATLLKTQRAIAAEPWISSVSVISGKTFMTAAGSGKSETTHLRITAHIRDARIEDTARARQLALLVLAMEPSAESMDLIQITLIHGYDIGIASSWRSQGYVHSPQEWRAQ